MRHGRPGGVILLPEDDVGRRQKVRPPTSFGAGTTASAIEARPRAAAWLVGACSFQVNVVLRGIFFRRALEVSRCWLVSLSRLGRPLPTGDRRSDHPRSIESSMMTGPSVYCISRAALAEYSHFLVRDIAAHGKLCVGAWEVYVSHARHMVSFSFQLVS